MFAPHRDPDVDVVVGTGYEWREAVENVPWETGDMLLLGSGAAGQVAQVFLGSAASKILRHAPVPVMIVPDIKRRLSREPIAALDYAERSLMTSAIPRTSGAEST